MSAMLEAALTYAARGWAVFPCKPGTKEPATAHGFKDASTDPEQIRRWWAKLPSANPAIATGERSGVWVLDPDNHDGKDGLATLAALEREHGPLPLTPAQRTGSGGEHRFFKMNGVEVRNSADKVGPGIDVRGNGGYVVLPPAVHPDGGIYEWIDACHPADVAPADAPGWLYELLKNKPRPEQAEPSRKGGMPLWGRYVQAAVEGEIGRVTMARDGSRNDTLNKAAFALGTFVGAGALDRGYAEAELLRAARAAGLEDTGAVKTINSGLNAGEQQPREQPEARQEERGAEQAAEEEDFNAGSSPEPAACSVRYWLDRDLPAPDMLLGPFSTTSRGLFVADTGLGKTNFAMGMAFGMATGQNFLHWDSQRSARVLFIDGEMSKRLLRARIRDAVDRSGQTPEFLYFLSRDDMESMPPLNTPAGQHLIDAFIEKIGGVDFVYFDNVQALLLGDMKDEEPWQQTLPWIRNLTRRHIGQLWIHHTGHETGRSYGTKTREWQLDTVMLAEAAVRPEADIAFSLKFTKARERTPDNRGDFEDVTITLANNQWAFEGSTPQKVRKGITPLGQKFLNALHEALARPGTLCHPAPSGRRGISLETWKAECRHCGLLDDEKPDSERALFSENRRALIGANLIVVKGDLVWPI